MKASDPLAQLRDIHLPDPVGYWPLAWGWWLLIALVVISLSGGLYAWLRHQRRNRYRQQAQKALRNALYRYRQSGDTAQYLQDISVILRRTALTAFPTEPVANLRHNHWLNFLDETLAQNQRPFTEGIGQVLLSGPYQPRPTADVDRLHQLASEWVARHRQKPGGGTVSHA